MADNVAEQTLQYLRDPAVVAGLGAAAVSLAYMATRPSTTPCPVNPKQQSIEIPVSILFYSKSPTKGNNISCNTDKIINILFYFAVFCNHILGVWSKKFLLSWTLSLT